MAVGAREFAEHERVEAVVLAGGSAEALTSGGDLVGMDCQHAQSGGQQTPDEQPVGALDRHACDLVLEQQLDQCQQSGFVVGKALLGEHHSSAVADANVVPLAGPIDPGNSGHGWSSQSGLALT